MPRRISLRKTCPLTTFTQLGLDAQILKSLETEGYSTPTPIQAQAIPPVMTGSDLLGIAQTGTGKTAAFALPILHRLAAERRQPPRRGCRALVLSPTRELASQIADSFRTYGRHLGVTVAVIFGGVGHRPQIKSMINGVDVLVATPGRLLDHVGERNVLLSGTEIFVLDEADQMLDLGFLQPIRKVVAQLSSKRQNLFFSATMPNEIGKLASELLHNPVKVSVAPASTTAERVSQRVIHIERHKKRAVLVELLGNADLKRTLVFTRTKRGADKVAEHLGENGISVAAIHGNKSQGQRERALEQFRRSEIRVLVATDIAARGIDIDQVSHVINFELPEVPEAYVHRIGRTARAGEAGIAISLCDPDERGQLREIERLTRQSLPHENRITGDVVPLDATGAPKGRPQTGHRGKPNGGGRPQHGNARGERADRGDRNTRSDAAKRAFHRGGDARDGAKPSGDGFKPRGDFAPRGERPDRGDRKPHGDGFKARGDFAPRGERSDRGDRKPHGEGFKPRGDSAPRGDRSDRGDRRADGAGFKPRSDFAPRGDRPDRGDRKPQGDGFKPRGDRNDRGAQKEGRKDFAPRQDGRGSDRGHTGKPGGFQGLKRKPGGGSKPGWSDRA